MAHQLIVGESASSEAIKPSLFDLTKSFRLDTRSFADGNSVYVTSSIIIKHCPLTPVGRGIEFTNEAGIAPAITLIRSDD